MANSATEKMMAEMVAFARDGGEIIPMMFQPLRGRSNTVSAAIRKAKALGLIEQSGLDGCGKPKYRAVIRATHAGTSAAQ
jgi:hypothetical protein